MVVQYNQTLTGTITANAVKDPETGDWTPGEQTSFTVRCRAEASSSGLVTNKDGVQVDYDWIVYMPNPIPKIQVGTTVVVHDSEGEILKDTVKRFSKGQLNSRAWL